MATVVELEVLWRDRHRLVQPRVTSALPLHAQGKPSMDRFQKRLEAFSKVTNTQASSLLPVLRTPF